MSEKPTPTGVRLTPDEMKALRSGKGYQARNTSDVLFEHIEHVEAERDELLAHARIVCFHLRRDDHVGEHGRRCTDQIIGVLEGLIEKAQP